MKQTVNPYTNFTLFGFVSRNEILKDMSLLFNRSLET